MDLHSIFAFVLAMTIFNSAQGQFTNGANAAECDSLVPAGVTPSSGEAPFSVARTAPTYTPGGSPITGKSYWIYFSFGILIRRNLLSSLILSFVL